MSVFDTYKLRTVVRSVAFCTILDQALVSLTNFVTGILILKFSGISIYGTFTMFWLLVLFFSNILTSFIIAPMYALTEKSKSHQHYLESVACLHLATSGVAVLLLAFALKLGTYFFSQLPTLENIPLLCVTAFSFWIQDFIRRYFFVTGAPIAAFVNDCISSLLQIIILAAYYFSSELTLRAILCIMSFTYVIAILTAPFQKRIRMSIPTKEQLTSVFKQHWEFSKWLIPAGIMTWCSRNYFIATGGVLLGTTAIGVLRAAQNFVTALNVLLLGFENYLPVRASQRYHQQGLDAMVNFLLKFGTLLLVLTSTYALILAMFPTFFLELVYGTVLKGYEYILQIIVICIPLIALALPIKSGLRALEINRPSIFSSTTVTIFSFFAAPYFINRWGVAGILLGIIIQWLIFDVLMGIAFKLSILKLRGKPEYT